MIRISAVISNARGKVSEWPLYEMAGRSGDLFRAPDESELILMPKDAEFSFLPDRIPVLYDSTAKKWEVLNSSPNTFIGAVILPIGYLRTLLPSYAPVKSGFLPQWAYTALGVREGRWTTAAIQIEKTDQKWNSTHYNTPDLEKLTQKKLEISPDNRIFKQLALCANDYHCNTAQNIFYHRWEGALPVSPACNAQCVGCISLQPEGLPPSSHERITFRPTQDEILEVALFHLDSGEDAIISFGQGCEGEPLLAGADIENSVRAIRTRIDSGTLNLNTNASRPHVLKKICEAGLNTLRISLNSTLKKTYESYYLPKGYVFEDVVESAKIAHDHRLGVSINLLTFPGVTDREEEIEGLIEFIHETKIDAIQWRNLAIDPDQYLEAIPKREGNILGIPQLIDLLKQEFPLLHHLSYSRPKKFFHPCHARSSF